jgi:Leucine-rich repeat (LRR) protein
VISINQSRRSIHTHTDTDTHTHTHTHSRHPKCDPKSFTMMIRGNCKNTHHHHNHQGTKRWLLVLALWGTVLVSTNNSNNENGNDPKMKNKMKTSWYVSAQSASSSSSSTFTIQKADVARDDTNSESSRKILLELYTATNGLDWTDSSNWFQQGSDVCDWKGVSCYSSSSSVVGGSGSDTLDDRRVGHVREIDLSGDKLVGTVPTKIFNLPYLETLILENNPDLDIDFTGIGNAQFLQELSISKTMVSNIDGIGNATALQLLHITDLKLSGPIPSSLMNLRTLEALYANYNSFSGPIPTEIAQLPKLKELYLYDSVLTGQLPTELGRLTVLEVLTLTNNAFGGTLPTQMNQMENLRLLAIQRTGTNEGDWKGPGISGPLPSFSKNRHLKEVQLENQLLNGPLSEDFLISAPEGEIVTVDLTNNAITGTVPSSLVDKRFLALYLADNQITSIPPRIVDTTTGTCPEISDWMGGDVGTVGCNAFLCPPGTSAPKGRKTSTDPCTACADDALHWGQTECKSATSVDVREREILLNLYFVLGGRNWKIDEGWLSLDVTPCQWHGIACDVTTGRVVSIILRNNGLSGTVPTDLFDLPSLQVLNLESNDIVFDFVSASKATSLQSLDLASTGLESLTGIQSLASLPSLTFLSLASNNLGGNIPYPVYSLTNLEELVISHNDFTGEISDSIGEMTNLKRFACDGNSFTGQLPATIGNLVALEEFSAAENEFSGSLPTTLNLLVNLRTLTLQQVTATGSGIGGPLLSFSNLSQLTTFKVDSNQLTGLLPSDFLLNSRHLEGDINVGLSDNQLAGSIPSEWSRFDKLFVDLAGNQISSIPTALCSKTGWMGGAVGEFQCDAILCPIGTYNNLGRKTDGISTCNSCPENSLLGATFCGDQGTTDETAEINILLDLFSQTGGPSWKIKTGWDNTTDLCKNWHGIECDGAGQVSVINLAHNNLKGTVPTSIYNLKSLREVMLSGNPVEFSFEGIGTAVNLINLYLDDTKLSSVDGIGDAVGLQIVNLADNNLEGEIPFDLYLLKSLKMLDLGFNFFSGRLNNAIGAMSSLESLRLYHNQFTGRIPAAFGDLTNLQELNLAENNFAGTIPPELNDLTNLRFLSIQREGGILGTTDVGINHGTSSQQGLGLTGPLPAFDKLQNIQELYLGANGLTGSIPYNFLDGVQDKGSFVKVDLTSNMLTGAIPASLTQFDAMSLYAAGNRITGIANGLCSKAEWMNRDVDGLACNGILCPAGTYNVIGRASPTSACLTCDTASGDFLGSFQCLSSTDVQEGSERSILELLYNTMDGPNWIDNTNWLDPDSSICDWFGIECVSDTIQSVSSIVLRQNRLKNTFPPQIYQLPNLIELNLQGNAIIFNFNEIANAVSLESLDLEDIGLTSLFGISQATGLKLLRVDGNDFSAFPTDVFSLTSIEVLSLSDNYFPQEAVPSGLSSLTSLSYFACSGCGFVGPIPSFFGSMMSLEYLRLSQNGLTGLLPIELESILTLKHLDLSEQASFGKGITGSLLSFANQTELIELFLQHNNFQGPIPTTFLTSVRRDELVTVDLRYNALTTLPVELGSIDNLNIYVSSNIMESIPLVLCAKNWNEGDVTTYGCDGISCASGTFNAFGRATADLECFSCDDPLHPLFLGSTYCGSALEHQSLIFLYRSYGGPNWKSDNNWLRNDDHCTWEGITCWDGGDFDGLVQRIELSDNNLIGAMPFGLIWQLEGLNYLDLSKNDITIPFLNMMNAINLETVILSETLTNSLEGINEGLSLKSLHLTSAALSGPIPDALFNLTTLEELYMSHNNFTGTLSPNIGELKELKDLYLFSNNLEGEIPTEIGYLARLEHLSLGNNKFVGTVPRQITSLPLLEFLSLENESGEPSDAFTPGIGLSGAVPALDGFPSIRELYMAHNSFTGSLPDHFLQGVHDKTAQITIDLSFNKIEGTIPAALSNFEGLSLLLAGNQISAVPDEICDKLGWMSGEVAYGCDAILCLPGTFNLEGRRVDAETLCEPCTYPGSARQYGSTSCGAGAADSMDDRAILFELYDAAGGASWTTSTGWKSDTVPICQWHGVVCSGQTVSELNLSGNNLNGIVPSVVFHLPGLRKVDISGNPVDMTFLGIDEAESLEELYMGETLVDNLDGIGKATALKILHVHNNSFGGQTIPDEIFNVITLTDLVLSENSFGGKLSSKVGQLTGLLRLTLTSNDLTGALPSEFGLLQSLTMLELSDNEWVGTLPPSWSDMIALETLYIDNTDAKGSGITGPLIPFATMPSMRELHLTENQLTGTIPSTFLSGVSVTDSVVNVRLNNNHLDGTVPAALATLSKLNIDIAGNRFTSIESGLCAQSGWNDGNVGRYGCDAILCPAGEYSPSGRQTNTADACEPCPGAENSPYLGINVCISLAKQREREILGILFQATNGKDWNNRDGWMDDSADICTWHGIACQEESTIESILLGSNNLSGSIPKEIYELPNLRFLWVHSNPVDISFDGIAQATNLQGMFLSSTKLRSLNGMGVGVSLVDLDVRFNQLSGPIPQEIASLTNLESLSMSVNGFTGPVPDFSTLTKLVSLRLGNNQLTGEVPAFSQQPALASVDLSNNKLTGPVPASFLQRVSSGQSLILDLSDNSLTGTVPGGLNRFADVTIYLRDNEINGIDPSLCALNGWNKGDVGTFNCDGILCPAGTYGASGRASSGGSTCEPCGQNQVLGQTTCGGSRATLSSSRENSSDSPSTSRPSATVFTFLILAVTTIVASALAL